MEQRKLPNATAVLILGILSIPGCCFYAIGLVFGIIALVLAKKDAALYAADPSLYDNYSNLKTGRILAIVGIVLNALMLLFIVIAVATFGWAAFQDPTFWQNMQQEMQNQ